MQAHVFDGENTKTLDPYEKKRREIVNLVIVVYVLLIIEGALRKWIFPGQKNLFYFVRDPFVILIYIKVASAHLGSRDQFYKKAKTFIFTISCLAVIQIMLLDVPAIEIIFGWRFFVFYIPLAFIIGENFNKKDLKKIAAITLLIAIPYAFIVFKQFSDGPTSIWNKTVTDTVYTNTGARGGGTARVTGTFTFFHSQQLFAGALAMFTLIGWVLPEKERPLPFKILLLSTASVAIIIGLDFTRGTSMLCGLVIVGTFVSSVYLKDKRMKRLTRVIPIALVVAMILALGIFFATASELRTKRMNRKGEVQHRLKAIFGEYKGALKKTPIFGKGLATSTSGGGALGGVYYHAGEEEWPRVISEVGPLVGLYFILFRIALCKKLIQDAIYATKMNNNPMPLIYISYLAFILVAWYITRIGSINGFAWLFTGFSLAANKIEGSEVIQSEGTAEGDEEEPIYK